MQLMLQVNNSTRPTQKMLNCKLS